MLPQPQNSSSSASRSNGQGNGKAAQSDTGYIPAPLAVSLPKGGGATQGMSEKFDINPVAGTGSFSVSIAFSQEI